MKNTSEFDNFDRVVFNQIAEGPFLANRRRPLGHLPSSEQVVDEQSGLEAAWFGTTSGQLRERKIR
jgi:hypothetical protein